ncbi:hypothetical protein Q3G72_017613 [Acer saccharum]|nr:hypothetical protein Q3G72_017613 [Acer saccharum]
MAVNSFSLFLPSFIDWLLDSGWSLWLFGRELQGPNGTLTQACADASAIISSWIPTLQMLAIERICFIPYWDRDPQCISKVLTSD